MVSLQKESEWENELREMIDGIAAYQHNVGDRAVLLVKKVLSNREKEIAEEVEKLLKEIPTQEELKLTVRSISIAQEAIEFHAHNKAIKEVLQIIEH